MPTVIRVDRRLFAAIATCGLLLSVTSACGGDSYDGLPYAEGWRAPGDEIPRLDDTLTASDWQRLSGPVTGPSRPQAYTGDSDPIGLPTDRAFVSGESLVFFSKRVQSNDYMPPLQSQVADVISQHVRSDETQVWQDLIDWAESERVSNLNWTAEVDGHRVANMNDRIVIRRDGTWTSSLATSDFSPTKVGATSDALFVLGQRRDGDGMKLWRWRPQDEWTSVLEAPDAVRLLRTDRQPAGGVVLIAKTSSSQFRWSDDLGESWSTLSVDNDAGESPDLQDFHINSFHGTASHVRIGAVDTEGESRQLVFWESEDLESWSRRSQPLERDLFRFDNLLRAESEDAALYVVGPDSTPFSKFGYLITDDGVQRLDFAALESVSEDILDVSHLADRWVVSTRNRIWVNAAPGESGWEPFEFRLPAAGPDIRTINDTVALRQSLRAHVGVLDDLPAGEHTTPDDGPWYSHPYRERGEFRDSSLIEFPSPFVKAGERMFLAGSKLVNDGEDSASIFLNVDADRGFYNERSLDISSLMELAPMIMTGFAPFSWRGQPTVYIRGEGLYAAQDGLNDWEKVGDPITTEEHGIEPASNRQTVFVTDFETFDGRLFAIASGAEEQRVIVEWNDEGDASVSLQRVPLTEEARQSPASSDAFTQPLDLFATDDVLIARTDRGPTSGVPANSDSGVSLKPFIRLKAGGNWRWLAWRNPPRSNALSSSGFLPLKTGPHTVFVFKENRDIFRYDPSADEWQQIPPAPARQSLSPFQYAVASDGRSLIFSGSRGGLWRLPLSGG